MLRQSTRFISAFTGNNAVKTSSAKYTVIGVPTKPPRGATTTVQDGKIPGKDRSEDVPHEWKDIKGVMDGEKKHGGEKGKKGAGGVVDAAKETMDQAKTKTKETLEEAEEKSKEAFNSAKNKLKETLYQK